MDELQHHGIKGQKWGVRRYQNQDGSLTDEGKKHVNSDGKAPTHKTHEDHDRVHDGKRAEELSDKELRERLNRINMEQQYNRLNPNSVERGHQILKNTLAVVGTVSATAALAIKIKQQYSTIASWF